MKVKKGFRTTCRLALYLALGLGSLFDGSSLVWGAEVRDLVQSHGLSPVDPPRPATDFSLPQLGAGEASLSDFSGSWVVLTFWASWCGPCRAEMPSLDALHRSHEAKGVVVLGVSLDRDSAAAQAFVREYRLTFPQLWDQQSRVGAAYQATAIPMSVLIDPEGRVVAISRGARDWSQLAGLMDSLIERVPPSSGASSVYAEALELPGVTEPPTAELRLSNSSPRPGEEFFLEVHLRWAGHMEEYLPQPPRVHLPAGITQKGVTASTSSRDGAQVVVYRITLMAAEAGSYALDPVELRYQPRLAADVEITQILGPTVVVEPRTVAGLAPRTLVWVTGGVAATTLAALTVGWRWKSSREVEPAADDSRFDAMLARYQEARNRRVQGDGAGSCLLMMDLLEELCEPAEREAEEDAKLAEGLRFGGHVPTANELDRIQREVGRRLEARRPNPGDTAREALRLQDDEERS